MVDHSEGYEAVAAEFAALRERQQVGARVIREWAATLPTGAQVLDVGCGSGAPVAAALATAGCRVWGVDASPTLATRFAARFPDFQVVCEDAVTSDLFGRSFDAVVVIGVVFLLPPERQRQLLQRVAAALVPGGRLLCSAPEPVAEWHDALTGRPSVSLGLAEYTRLLAACGLTVEGTQVDEGENHYLDARHSAAPDQRIIVT